MDTAVFALQSASVVVRIPGSMCSSGRRGVLALAPVPVLVCMVGITAGSRVLRSTRSSCTTAGSEPVIAYGSQSPGGEAC